MPAATVRSALPLMLKVPPLRDQLAAVRLPEPPRVPPESERLLAVTALLKLAVAPLRSAVPAPVRVALPLNACVPAPNSIVVLAAASNPPVCVPPVVGLIRRVPPPLNTFTVPLLLKFAMSSVATPPLVLFCSVPLLLKVPFCAPEKSSGNPDVPCRSKVPLLLIVAPLANRTCPDAPVRFTVPLLLQVPVS